MRTVLPAFLAVAILGGAVLLLWLPAAARDVPTPRVDRVDYANPDAQRTVPPGAGAGKRATGIAAQLKGATETETLGNIARWLGRNLRRDPAAAKAWRPVEEILANGTRGTAADLVMVFGVLARGAGIPAVWVKTVPLAWPADYKAGRAMLEGEVGKVFLEVHVGGRWRLLDPATARLYDDYDPRTRLLPGNALAYDKGGDPYALVLPNRPSAWKAQTASYFAALDLGRVPWARTTDLLARWRVYITGKGGAASYASAAASTLGFEVASTFNVAWARNLARARGKTLIVTCRGLKPNLPEAFWRAWLPPGHREVFSGARKLDKGWVAHRLPNGTRVILVTAQEFGPVELAVSEALDG